MFEEIRKGFEAEDPVYLRRIANELAENAAVSHSKELAELSVIAYALSKILSKPHFKQSPRWRAYRGKILRLLSSENVFPVLRTLEREIREMDERDGAFVKNVVDKSRTKMAARAYTLGLSLSTAADLFGADRKDLGQYLGQTKVHDEEYKIGIKERLDALRRLEK